MFFINEIHSNDTHIVNGEEICEDVFEITTAEGDWADEIRVTASDNIATYIAALEAAGWHFTGAIDFDGGQIAKN